MKLSRAIRYGRNGMPYLDPRDKPAMWTPRQSYVWERASYSVPASVSEERVQTDAPKYRNKFGKYLEGLGFRVLAIDGPHLDRSLFAEATTDPDRRRYVLRAKVTRRPVTEHTEVPDEDVPIYQKAGFRLT